jgi:hypothetical protein
MLIAHDLACSKALTAFGTSSAFWRVLMFEFSSKLAPAAAARMYQDLRTMINT